MPPTGIGCQTSFWSRLTEGRPPVRRVSPYSHRDGDCPGALPRSCHRALQNQPLMGAFRTSHPLRVVSLINLTSLDGFAVGS